MKTFMSVTILLFSFAVGAQAGSINPGTAQYKAIDEKEAHNKEMCAELLGGRSCYGYNCKEATDYCVAFTERWWKEEGKWDWSVTRSDNCKKITRALDYDTQQRLCEPLAEEERKQNCYETTKSIDKQTQKDLCDK